MLQGIAYPTLTSAADAYGVSIKKVSRRIKSGWSIEQTFDLEPPPKRRSPTSKILIVGSKKFSSIKQASEFYKVSPTNVRARLKLGWSLEEALEIVPRLKEQKPMSHYKHVSCDGKEFSSIGKLADFYGLPYKLVYKRFRLNWTAELAVGLENPPERYRNEDGSKRKQSWVKPAVIIDGNAYPDSATGSYYLYVIENSINDKKYIGITTNSLPTRFNGHKAAATSGEGKDRSLYNAMRKYGIDKFSIRLLRSDASSIQELLDQEVQAIKEHDTLLNGYNTSYGGTLGTSKSIEVNGEMFASFGQAADFYGIDAATFNQRISKLGWTPEQAAELVERPKFGRRNKTYSLIHKGIPHQFSSQAQAARFFGLNASTVNLRLKNGWTLEQALELDVPPDGVKPINRNGYVLEGKEFRNLTEVAKAYDVSSSALARYIRESDLSLNQSLYILKNDLGKHMQRIMVSKKCSHLEAFKQLEECSQT